MLELILAGLLVLGIIQAVKMAVLTIATVIDWFQQQQAENKVDVKAIGFTIREALDKGSYRVVQGVFNPLLNQVTAARSITSAGVDETLAQLHDDNPVVLYE